MRHYVHEDRAPPSLPHLTRLVKSVISNYAVPFVNIPPEEKLLKWSEQVLIPFISWTHRTSDDSTVTVQYHFSSPSKIFVSVNTGVIIGDTKYRANLNIQHTVDEEYKFSLKGLCAIAICKNKKENENYFGDLKEKVPESLFDYIVQCDSDMQDFEYKGKRKRTEEQTPDHFVFSFYKDNGDRRDKTSFHVGSNISYTASDFTLSPDAYYLEAWHKERCINIDLSKKVDENPVFKAKQAPENRAIKSAPQVLSSLLYSPENILELTTSHMNKLTEYIFTEATENLRYIADMDLAYSGGGLGGVTVDLAQPSQEQRETFNQSVHQFKNNNINLFLSHKNDIVPVLKKILSYLPIINSLIMGTNEQLFIFERDFDWAKFVHGYYDKQT